VRLEALASRPAPPFGTFAQPKTENYLPDPVAHSLRPPYRFVVPYRFSNTLSMQGVTPCLGRPAPLRLQRTRDIMSEPFRPYEKLVEISIMGKKFQVPERNSLLRCFQFISPETIPYGRFCWNQDCQYCRVSCQLPDDDEPREMLSCKFIVMPGMEITEMSQELKWCLRAKLPSGAAVGR